jgi:hypothetical protein
MEKSEPAPVSVTTCELPRALSVMVKVPVLVPLVLGSKNTPMEQLEPGLTLLPQSLSGPKSVGLVATLVIVSTLLPVLLSITDWGSPDVPTYWLGKVTLAGDKLTPLTPAPVKATSCGLPETLSVNVSEALAFPKAAGVKVTLMLQLLLAGRDDEQLLVWAKLPLLTPVRPMDVIARVP